MSRLNRLAPAEDVFVLRPEDENDTNSQRNTDMDDNMEFKDKKKEPNQSIDVATAIKRITIFNHDYYKNIHAKNLANYYNIFGINSKSDQTAYKEVVAKLLSNETLKLVAEDNKGSNRCEKLYANESLLLKISEFKGEEGCAWQLEYSTTDEKLSDYIVEKLNSYRAFKAETQSEVFLIHRANSGYYLNPLGTPRLDFNENNYSEEIVDNYKEVRKRLTEKNPFGRLTILEGPPGTGKTSFIRALITNNNEGIFVIFPVTLLNNLDSSDLISFLAQTNHDYGKPVVLILEDADMCLLPREDGSMNFISTLLNSADGIIGSCIDNRIIATTNSEFKKIDPAIIRPGRLLKHIAIGKLDAERASKCLQTITNDDTLSVDKPMTLAEVYEQAYQVSNSRKEDKKRNPIGF